MYVFVSVCFAHHMSLYVLRASKLRISGAAERKCVCVCVCVCACVCARERGKFKIGGRYV